MICRDVEVNVSEWPSEIGLATLHILWSLHSV